MEAKDTLAKILEALIELQEPVKQNFFIDFVCSKDNESMEEEEDDKTQLETYGILSGEDDALIEVVIKEAEKAGYIDYDSDGKTLTFTEAGQKFKKKPKSFKVDYDDEDAEAEVPPMDTPIDPGIDDLMQDLDITAAKGKKGIPGIATPPSKSSLKIKLIQAIDRKKDLDDFAESQGQDFDDILDELESIIQSGTRIDIMYFIQEIMEQDNIDELMDFLDENGADLKQTIREYEDAYSVEEIRLVYIEYLCKHKK